jgi:predicted PolB exonuclease-like 3'-5' exonuclease
MRGSEQKSMAIRKAVIDIETIPTNVVPEATEEDIKKASLDPLQGRIACIGLIFIDGFDAYRKIGICADDEREILKRFWSSLREENVHSFVAHNGLQFDLPFIWKRSVVLQVKPPFGFDLRRYRNDFVYDTMNVWSNWELRGNAKLGVLAEGLNIGNKNGEGSQVFQLWSERRFDDILTYCLHDCWLTYACFCKMNFTGFKSFEDIAMGRSTLPALELA